MTSIVEPHFTDIDLLLPIAPQANHRLRSASEEKLPPAMVPAEAIAWIRALRQGGRKINSIELKGPGDALALIDHTISILDLLRSEAKDAEISVTTLGISAAEHAEKLAGLGVKTISLLVDTVRPETAARLYAWVRPAKKNVPLPQATEILITEQVETARAMHKAGIAVVIKTTIHPGINNDEMVEIATKMAAAGASKMDITLAGVETDAKATDTLHNMVIKANIVLPTTITEPTKDMLPPGTPQPKDEISIPKPSKDRPNVAVVSANGIDVNLHLGHAWQILIYGARNDGLACLLETRDAPEGGDSDRWQKLADSLGDCFALLATHAGDIPRNVLAERGIKVILTEDNIEGLVDVLLGDHKKCRK